MPASLAWMVKPVVNHLSVDFQGWRNPGIAPEFFARRAPSQCAR